jgi:hypothetical protein
MKAWRWQFHHQIKYSCTLTMYTRNFMTWTSHNSFFLTFNSTVHKVCRYDILRSDISSYVHNLNNMITSRPQHTIMWVIWVVALHTSLSGNKTFASDGQFRKLLKTKDVQEQQKTSRMTGAIKCSCESAASTVWVKLQSWVDLCDHCERKRCNADCAVCW